MLLRFVHVAFFVFCTFFSKPKKSACGTIDRNPGFSYDILGENVFTIIKKNEKKPFLRFTLHKQWLSRNLPQNPLKQHEMKDTVLVPV